MLFSLSRAGWPQDASSGCATGRQGRGSGPGRPAGAVLAKKRMAARAGRPSAGEEWLCREGCGSTTPRHRAAPQRGRIRSGAFAGKGSGPAPDGAPPPERTARSWRDPAVRTPEDRSEGSPRGRRRDGRTPARPRGSPSSDSPPAANGSRVRVIGETAASGPDRLRPARDQSRPRHGFDKRVIMGVGIEFFDVCGGQEWMSLLVVGSPRTCPGRGAAHQWCAAEPGPPKTQFSHRARDGPGSAMHR